MSKAGGFCDRFIEAGWLAALALAQWYVAGASSHGYAVAKAYLLRFIVPLMAAAWLIKHWEERAEEGAGRRSPSFWKQPLALPILAYVVVTLLTSATSVAPRLSFNGSLERLQGAYTTVTYALFFLLIAANLRSREQFNRIVSVVVLTSIPICLYAVAQQLGLDPARYAGPADTLMWAARSTLGNHIFLGAYLIMVMPWTAARLVEAARDYLRGEAPAGAPGAGRAALAAGALLLQNLALLAFLLYGIGYEPLWWMNLPVLTACLFLLIWTLHLRPRFHPLIAVSAYTAILSLQGSVLLLTQARGPWVGAFAGAVVFGLLASLRWRLRRLLAGLLLGAAASALFVVVLTVPSGPLEPLKRHPVLKRLATVTDVNQGSGRFRVRLWQSVWNLALSGHRAAPAVPFAAVRPAIGYGPETLGLMVERTLERAIGMEEPWMRSKDRAHNDFLHHLAESGLIGLGAYLWLLASFAWLALKALRRERDFSRQLYLIALLAAMAAHQVELLFGIGVTSTRLLFWLGLALAVFLARPLPESDAGELTAGSSPWKSRMVHYVLYVAAAVFLILGMGLRIAFSTVGVSVGLLLSLGGMLAGICLLALELGPSQGERRAPARSLYIRALAVGGALLLLYRFSFRPQAADAIFTLGQADPGQTVFAVQQASRMEPGESAYEIGLGRFLARVGLVLLSEKPEIKPPEGFQPSLALAHTLRFERMLQLGGEGVLGLAEAAIQQARRLQPLDGRYAYLLGRLNHVWGLRGKPERLDTAIRYYREASEMSPTRLSPFVHLALAYLGKRQPQEALEQIQAARALGYSSWSVHYVLALIHHQMGNAELARRAEELAGQGANRRRRVQLAKLLEQGKLRPDPIGGAE